MKMSFYDWCIKNSRQDLLDRWDYNLNNCSPNKITWATNKKMYFMCDKHTEHHSILVRVASLTSASQNILCLECHSFAQWVIDNYGKEYLCKIWNLSLNKKSPWSVAAKSHETIYLDCDKINYHKGYKTTPARYASGQKVCGFCHMSQIHPNDSFAAHNIRKFGDDFLDKYWDYSKNQLDPYCISPYTKKKVWIKCQDKSYHESYDVMAQDFSYGRSQCPYCRSIRVHKNDSLLFYYPNVALIWSDKNDNGPENYSLHSAKFIWLKCSSQKHKDFKKQVRDAIECCFRCPECTRERQESFLQEKVRTYILNNYDVVLNHEYQCTISVYNIRTNHQMPYDNELIFDNGARMIIEVHGEQHYRLTPFAVMQAKYKGGTPEQALEDQQYRDRIKKEYAISQGYEYLEIPYWTERDESYKTFIDDKIHEILTLKQNKITKKEWSPMAQGNKYTCKCCGTEYIYCPSCELKTPAFDKESFCSQAHADIFNILSKHGCKLATAEDTLKALSAYNIDSEKFTPSIRKHISAIKVEAKPTTEVKQTVESKPFIKEEKK